MSEQRISTAPIKQVAIERGIDNPFKLATETGVSYPTARKWWFDEGMTRIDAQSLITFVRYFGCQFDDLLEIVDA